MAWRDTLNYFAADARGEALPERHLATIDPPTVEYRRSDGRRKIKGLSTAQRAAAMRRFRGQPDAESVALQGMIAQRRAEAGLDQAGQPGAQKRVSDLAARKQQLMKSGWSSTQADQVIEKEEAAKRQKSEAEVKSFEPVVEGTRTINRSSPLAKLPPGELERTDDLPRVKTSPKMSSAWFSERLKKGRQRAAMDAGPPVNY